MIKYSTGIRTADLLLARQVCQPMAAYTPQQIFYAFMSQFFNQYYQLVNTNKHSQALTSTGKHLIQGCGWKQMVMGKGTAYNTI